MKIILLCFFTFFGTSIFGQIPKYFLFGGIYSKEISLYKSKEYVVKNVLNIGNEVIKFQVTPLAAATSGELTTLVYKCRQRNKEGLILSFYGDYWNDGGIKYTGYAFKDIEKKNAIILLEKLSSIIHDNYEFLSEINMDDYNISYREDDMLFIFYNTGLKQTKIRVFWSGFDSEWDAKSLYKTRDKLKEE